MTCSRTTKNEAIISKKWFTNFSANGFKNSDIVLLVLVCALVFFGLLMVYSSSFIYAQERTGDGFAFIKKQFVWAILGFGSLFFAAQIPIERWVKWAYPISFTAFFLLVLVLIPGLGARVGGAQRWIHLGPVNIQPAEFVKFALLFFMAKQLDKKQSDLHRFIPGVVAPFLLPLVCMVLLLLQPDFGSCAIIALVGFILLYFAGVSKKYLGIIVAVGGSLAASLVLSTPYRRARLMTFLDPWQDPMGKGFQVLQSMLGLHNGGFWGVGLGNGKEKLFYLPEAHNDFIFAVIGEELGFIGVTSLIAVFVFLIFRGLRISALLQNSSRSNFATYLALGITLTLGLQFFVNIAVVVGALPTKGLTLPFISYGGSSLFFDLAAIGVLLGLSKEARGEL